MPVRRSVGKSLFPERAGSFTSMLQFVIYKGQTLHTDVTMKGIVKISFSFVFYFKSLFKFKCFLKMAFLSVALTMVRVLVQLSALASRLAPISLISEPA